MVQRRLDRAHGGLRPAAQSGERSSSLDLTVCTFRWWEPFAGSIPYWTETPRSVATRGQSPPVDAGRRVTRQLRHRVSPFPAGRPPPHRRPSRTAWSLLPRLNASPAGRLDNGLASYGSRSANGVSASCWQQNATSQDSLIYQPSTRSRRNGGGASRTRFIAPPRNACTQGTQPEPSG